MMMMDVHRDNTPREGARGGGGWRERDDDDDDDDDDGKRCVVSVRVEREAICIPSRPRGCENADIENTSAGADPPPTKTITKNTTILLILV